MEIHYIWIECEEIKAIVKSGIKFFKMFYYLPFAYGYVLDSPKFTDLLKELVTEKYLGISRNILEGYFQNTISFR